ncbi:MAG: hypothetical protein QME81_16980, partial [bacterium]|nr:hypothetical protein [bacterium]
MVRRKKKCRYVTEREVRKKGRQDGNPSWKLRFGWPFWEFPPQIPSIDQNELTEYEEKLIGLAQENLSRITQEWAEEDKALYQSCRDAEDRYKRTEENKKKEVPEHKEASDRYEEAKEEFNKQPMPHISSAFGLFLIGIITVGECFFNALVFNIFGQSQIHTWIMAFGVMIAIPWCARFTGKTLRLKDKSATDIIIMVIGVSAVIAVLAVIALLREKFLEAMKVSETMGIELEPSSMGLSFFVINLLFFVAMFTIEYEKAHKDPEAYKKAKKALKEAKKGVKKEGGEAKASVRGFEEAQREFNEAHSSRTHKFEEIKLSAASGRNQTNFGLQIA